MLEAAFSLDRYRKFLRSYRKSSRFWRRFRYINLR